MNVNWTQVLIKNSFDPEARQNPQFVALSDNRRLIINGGSQYDRNPVKNRSIVFDAQDNTWQKLPDFPSENNTRSEGTAISIPSAIGDTVVLFGGKMINVYTIDFGKGTAVTKTNTPYMNSTIYNTSPEIWAYLTPQLDIPITSTPIGQSATFNQRSGIIYYFGGKTCSTINHYLSLSGLPSRDDYINCTFSSLAWGYIFDTKKAMWDRNNYTAFTGSKIPSSRQHLTTVLASDFQHVIMYGGENDAQVVSDFLYTLDLNNNTWTQVNVETNGSDLTRASHSAVLVNSTLFILFGKNSNGYATTMLAYNVTDLSNIHPINYYYSDTISTNTTMDQPSPLTPSAPHSDTESLSAGAKAGIAVGSIVGAVAIFSALFLFYRKKSKEHIQPSVQDPDEHIMDEKNDLDWNNIERQYFELDTPSTTAVAESLYRNSTDQQALPPNANTSSTYTVLKTTEISQTPSVKITHTMESSVQTPDALIFHITGLSQTPDAVTK
ncbi:hypothetical protein AB4K20DRAFT_1904720 [Rhizopus microsporus]